MKSLGYAASLLLLTVGVTILPTPAGAVPASSRTPAEELREDARGTVSVTREPATDQLGFVRTGPQGDLLDDVEAAPATKADEYLDRHGDAFGAPAEQLMRQSVETDEVGTTVTYTQEYRGVPVWGAMLKANLSPEGALRSVNGAVVPDLDLSVVPALDAAEAGRRAVALVRADPPGDDKKAEGLDSLEAGATELVVYREGLVRGEPGESSLAYTVEVTNGANIAEMVVLTASKGTLLNRFSSGDGAVAGPTPELYSPGSSAVPFWQGGDSDGGLTLEQRAMVDGAEETYWFFANAFGIDSYDDAGAPMRAIDRTHDDCRNAVWNLSPGGSQRATFCKGTTSDDIVAHEWMHAYTQHVGGSGAAGSLISQWQPGALNESYSDIFGEVVDLINNRDDEDEGLPSTPRTDGADDACAVGGSIGLTIQVAGDPEADRECIVGIASFGPPLDSPGVDGEIVEALGTPAEGAEPGKDGCAAPLVNAGALAGQIALVEEADDGACAPVDQARNAQEAGAQALIIGSDDETVDITPAEDAAITIPVVKIGEADYEYIEGHLGDERPVSGTLADTRTRRWLIGEKSPGLGGTVRDMWRPQCYGDPGRVGDAEYWCAPEDGGGIHTNAGVPNHGFALVVDGGTYNGVTVRGIGLTKAAHIYFRAWRLHTPTDGFADQASLLYQACQDLQGAPLTALSTAPDDSALSPDTIVASDCAAVYRTASAVELRRKPTQCAFKPQFRPDAPVMCADSTRIWSDNFGQGISPARWTQTSAAASTGSPIAWESPNVLPGGRPGVAAYAADPNKGTCVPGSASWAGRSSLTSRQIVLPASAPGLTRMTFDHYVATESGFDGGNVKVKVGNAPFRMVPYSAYLFNKPNTQFSLGEHAHQMGGEQVFSGTDEGGLGSWVESQIDLGKVGAQPGDSIQVRFDFGRDACDGVDGWYVDDVEISVCGTAATVSTVGPGRSTYARQASLRVTTSGSDGAPYGTVQVRTETGQLLSESQPFSGTATLPLDRLLPARQTPYALTVRYLGSPLYAETETRHQLRVLKAPSKTTLNVRPRRVRQGATVQARLRVTAVGFRPTGRVVLRAKGRIVGRATVKKSRTSVVRITRALPPGRHQVVARYAGNANTKPSTKRVVLRVVRR